jgi:hypothetical protein
LPQKVPDMTLIIQAGFGKACHIWTAEKHGRRETLRANVATNRANVKQKAVPKQESLPIMG